MTLTLHILNKTFSSWSMRPWLCLVRTGAPFTEVVHLAQDPDYAQKLRAVSPTGLVPLLVDGDVVLHESLAIIEYLAERFPEARLWPEDAAARAYARSISAEMHAGFSELRRNCSMNLALRTRMELDPATRRDLQRFETIVAETRSRFGADGPFLFGEFGAVDAMYAPVCCRIRTYGLEVSETTRAYVEAIENEPGVARWIHEALIEAAHTPAMLISNIAPKRVVSGSIGERLPPPSTWAVIFTSKRTSGDDGYGELASRMVERSESMPGFRGIASARGADGVGITVCYWDSLDSLRAWGRELDHREAQARGRESFYASFDLRIARVEGVRTFERRDDGAVVETEW